MNYSVETRESAVLDEVLAMFFGTDAKLTSAMVFRAQLSLEEGEGDVGIRSVGISGGSPVEVLMECERVAGHSLVLLCPWAIHRRRL
jgi:hypothetical protein